MPNLTVDYNGLPEKVKAYVDATQDLAQVVHSTNQGVQDLAFEGIAGDAVRATQESLTAQANQTLNTSAEDQQYNAQMISENMSNAESDVQSENAKVEDMVSDIKL